MLLGVTMLISTALVAAGYWGASKMSAESVKGIVRKAQDDCAYIASRAMHSDLAQSDAVLLGTSSVREAFWESPLLREECLKKGGINCQILQLVASAQSFFESLFLLYDADLKNRQKILIFITPILFAYNAEESLWRMQKGLYLKNPMKYARDFHQVLPELKGMIQFPDRYLTTFRIMRVWANRRIYLAIKQWFVTHVYGQKLWEYDRYWYFGDESGDIERIRLHMAKIQRKIREGFHENKVMNERALSALIHHLKSKSCEVVLMESPRLDFESMFEPWEDEYVKIVQRVSAEHGIPYVDLNPESSLEIQDFVDSRHVTGSGRNKWSKTFVDWWLES